MTSEEVEEVLPRFLIKDGVEIGAQRQRREALEAAAEEERHRREEEQALLCFHHL